MQKAKQYIHVIIALILLLAVKLLVPAANGLTEIGVNVLAVLAPILYLWIAVGSDWTSLLALAAIICTGVLTPTEVYGGALGSPVIIIVITMMALNQLLMDTGVIATLSKWVMTREVVRGRPYVFIALFFLLCLLLCLVTDVGCISIMFIALASGICKEIGYKKGDPFYTALIIGIFWISNIGNCASPMGHTVPLIMLGTASAAGYEISIPQWLSIGLPFAVVMYLLTLLVVCVIWKPEASKFHRYDLDAARKEIAPLTREGIFTSVIFILMILWWILPEMIPGLFPAGVRSALSTWGNTIPPVAAVTLLCIVRFKGKPLSTFSAMTRNTPIGILLFVAAVVVLGTAVSSEATGISAALSNILAPITSVLSPFWIVFFAILFCLILTNFISNTVSMMIFYSLTIPAIANTGISQVGVIIMICCAACFASLVPSAAVTAPFFFGDGHITVRNTLKWNIVMIFLAFVAIMGVMYPLASILF